jgi:enoyl-CoA hydratase/carnithine racemase
VLANVIVAAEGAAFQNVGHFAGGVVPGDGIFTIRGYRAGAARAFLLNPQPLPARTTYEWGVVAEIVPDGSALSRGARAGRALPESSGGKRAATLASISFAL